MPSLAVSSLNLKLQDADGIRYTDVDYELNLVLPLALPSELVSHLRVINIVLNKSVPIEANIRFKINDLHLSACLVATTSKGIASVPISLQTESACSLSGVKHKGKKWNLNGKSDYTVCKGEGKGMTGLPQSLGYMGIVHRRRKLLGKNDCTVYGVCCDDVHFLFLKLDNYSRWSERLIIARNDKYETVFGPMVFMMKKAMLLSPMHSKESSAQTHHDQEPSAREGLVLDERMDGE
ncbi:uncharacterized protein N7484_007120 [Penicillium longicatenatum]|uniref:uncharacterized protein n=1 Tax=Penicillium longicatenatum TaxID=1561947 RepID=UPI002547231B|nr:uncharacterized protein N7484_007120 [Penicillium longicatenatum]KAJ5639258.1 hypothetical protein N7484_007120 [Penicillium longicatenatum]